MVPQNGSVDCAHMYGDFAYNSSCRYFCEEGYQLSTPGLQRCNEAGNWTEVSPTCECEFKCFTKLLYLRRLEFVMYFNLGGIS